MPPTHPAVLKLYFLYRANIQGRYHEVSTLLPFMIRQRCTCTNIRLVLTVGHYGHTGQNIFGFSENCRLLKNFLGFFCCFKNSFGSLQNSENPANILDMILDRPLRHEMSLMLRWYFLMQIAERRIQQLSNRYSNILTTKKFKCNSDENPK